MNNIILPFTFKILCPLLAFYSLYILVKGHNAPGGGFIGGLLLGFSIIFAMRFLKLKKIKEKLRKNFYHLIAISLLIMLLNTIVPLFFGESFFEGLWPNITLPIIGKLSSVLLFDVCVYLVVFLASTYSYIIISNDGDKTKKDNK